MAGRLYFAYGSNLNLEQMERRCPAAKPIGPAMLHGYELRFRGNYGGSGVATIAPKQGSHVAGLLWELTPACEQALDRYEGCPHLYEKQTVTAWDRGSQPRTGMAYVMRERLLEPAAPSAAYYNSILEGYRENGLPVVWLRRAWERTVREVYQRTEQVNKQCTKPAKTSKRRNGHAR